tara:strand:- start:2134 stop:2460 length:327 start_codon:yes stop_codon:yes gene_type:complete
MEFKGTKGEWVNGYGKGLTGPTTPTSSGPTVDKNRKYTPISIGQETIAIVIQQENDSMEELASNAKLIASAPELLKALRSAYRCSGERNTLTKPVLDEMLNAINKALN